MPRPGTSSGQATIKGTRGNDTISVVAGGVLVNGSLKPFTDAQIDAGLIIAGNAGHDFITGGRGPDEIDGGAGGDRLVGGGGFDRLLGGDGNDILIDDDLLVDDPDPNDGYDPNSVLGAYFDGGRGIDTIDFSGSGVGVSAHLGGALHADFTMESVDGHPLAWWDPASALNRISNVENLVGSAYNDILWGAPGDNEIHGGAGNDLILGGDPTTGNDRLFGDAGDDFLYGHAGDDELTGGTGLDTFIFDGTSPNSADVILDYMPGEDSLVFQFSTSGPNWVQTLHNGIPSLLGTYEDGSVIVVGVTDPAQLTVHVTEFGW